MVTGRALPPFCKRTIATGDLLLSSQQYAQMTQCVTALIVPISARLISAVTHYVMRVYRSGCLKEFAFSDMTAHCTAYINKSYYVFLVHNEVFIYYIYRCLNLVQKKICKFQFGTIFDLFIIYQFIHISFHLHIDGT